MICLNPPYHVIDGYTVLPDHADPILFYVLPAAPSLAQGSDGCPAFSLVQYQGGGLGQAKIEGGLLTLTTQLAVPEDVLPGLRERIAKAGGREAGDVRLTPVMFDGGSVELVALGATSVPVSPGPSLAGETSAGPAGNEASGASGGSGPFQVQFLGSGKPSLGGANTTTFQLVLDAAAAELVERAMETPDLPIVAIYRMTFAGLRPSFQIDISADWSRVYSSLRNQAKVNVYYVAADVETMVTKALEENHIRVDTAVFGTGEGARASAERARKQLVDWVLERMFQPLADPKAATTNAVGQVIDDTIWSLTRSLLPGLSYRLRMVDDEQVRTMSARMNEAVAEVREVVPQSTLGGALNRYRVGEDGQVTSSWPELRRRLLKKVPLDGFPRLEVQVASEDRFACDGVSEVRVELARQGPDGSRAGAKTLVLRNASEREAYIVNLLDRAGADLSNPYQYRVEVQFDPSGPFGPHPPVSGDWQTGRATELFVEPRSVYMVRDVRIGVAPTFSFEQYPSVTVELRYSGDGDPVPPAGRVNLTAEKPNQSWRFRSFAAHPLPYEYQVTYHRPPGGGSPVTVPWRPETDDCLTVADPMPTKRPMNLFISLPWQDIVVAYIQIRYSDPSNGIQYDEQIDLSATTRYLRRDLAIADRGLRTISYRLTVLFQSGELLEGSWRETEEERLVIDRRLIDRRVISVRTIGGSLAANRLSEVRIGVCVRDPATGQPRAETAWSLTAESSGAELPPWEYLLGDPPVRTVEYTAVFVDRNGFATRIPSTSTASDLLIVNLRTQAVMA